MNSSPKRTLPLAILVGCLLSLPTETTGEEVEVYAEVAKILTSRGEAQDDFGRSVSLDGDRMAVGAPFGGSNGTNTGAVYVFERDESGGWTEVSRILALDRRSSDYFGHSLSLEGDRLAVGAYGDDVDGVSTGSAYIFERGVDGAWSQQSKLMALDGESSDQFGISVSLDGDRLAVGADGSYSNHGTAYIFERDQSGRWAPVDRVAPENSERTDCFGSAVDLDGEWLVVGRPLSDVNGGDSGSAHLFELDEDGKWTEVVQLVAPDGETESAHFGHSLSLDGERLAIGAHRDDDSGPQSGAVYLFELDGSGTWIPETKIVALPDSSGNFGYSVSLDADLLAVGAIEDDANAIGGGSAYIFERTAQGEWTPISQLLTLDREENDFLGVSVSLDNRRLAAGAAGDDDSGLDSGAVLLFEPVGVSPQLSIWGSCPGEVELTSSGTTPRSRFDLYGSSTTGSFAFETGPCRGELLGLDAPSPLRQTDSDFDAEGTLTRRVDESWCGSYLQVIDLKTCLTSEVVQVPLQAGPMP